MELRVVGRRTRARLLAGDPSLAVRLRERLSVWLSGQPVRSVGFYWPLGSEPDVTQAVRTWLEASSGGVAALPVVDVVETGVMHYVRWRPESALRAGAFGILEPDPRDGDDVVVPEVVLAPCVGFTEDGFRLGAGGGFFDRYLALRGRGPGRPVTVAVAFEGLACPGFVPGPHDQPFDWIATEQGVRPSVNTGSCRS